MRFYLSEFGERKEDVTRCIEAVVDGWHERQCYRKRGYGKDGLYCKQHAKKHHADPLEYRR